MLPRVIVLTRLALENDDTVLTRGGADIKLTDANIKTLATPETGNRITFDDAVKGFGIRVTAAGARAFVLNYRTAGRQRRYTIGAFPDWATSVARQEAKRLKAQIRATGADPVGEIESERSAPTVGDMIDRYIAEHLPKKRPGSQRGDVYMIDKWLAPMRSLKVSEITFDHADRLHRKITREGRPIAGNRALTVLTKMFALAIKWRWRTDNPCKGIERNPENKRTRYLSTDEIVRLNAALADLDDRQAAKALTLLLLTGARSMEVLAAKWADFDLSTGVWVKPGSTTKQKTEHRVPLSGPARLLLAEMSKNVSGEYVFPGRYTGHRATVRGAWDEVCEAAGLRGVRVHDLRHSYASVLASAGVPLYTIGGLLGHNQPSTTARYAHLVDDALRAATERAGHVIAGGESAEVKPFRRRK
jgi:integrase